MALAPAYHFMLFHTMLKRPMPSLFIFLNEKLWLLHFSFYMSLTVVLYAMPNDSDEAKSQL